MNCSQAQALLAEYRELKNAQATNGTLNGLEAHLAECSACRQVLAQQELVGSRIRSLPLLEPSPEARTRLLQALAAEHMHFLQHSSPASMPPPLPAFLMPYLKEHARQAKQPNALTALSTADTGPVPLIHARQRRHRRPRRAALNHFAIVGAAAAILMIVMMGGLISLLLLANHGVPNGPNTVDIANTSQVSAVSYTTTSTYPHVASAVADRNAIYYSAYNNDATSWMLQRFDIASRTSTPLLSHENTTPLIVLGSSQNWLLWLDMGERKPVKGKYLASQEPAYTYSWSLHALYLGDTASTTDQAASSTLPVSLTLQKGTFDESTAPSWIRSPIQGIWFIQNSLLVTTLDAKGGSHLWQYQLDPGKNAASAPKELASASKGHVLTSPTASGNGSNIYWAEEWQTSDGTLHSNIWQQHTTAIMPSQPGKWAPHAATEKHVLLSDGHSFHPQVANDTLFFLSTAQQAGQPTATQQASQTASTTASATSTASAAATGQPSATATATTNASLNESVAAIINTTQIDRNIEGVLMIYPPAATQPVALDKAGNGPVLDLQGGPRFLLWRDASKGIAMYDAATQLPVTIGTTIPKDPALLIVNGETVVWVAKETPDKNTTGGGVPITFNLFSWPTRVPGE
ncbi:MAG: hypothetical protein IMW89_07390 [Ktedonobacteraceae bacterium]|nr:hypothetical protein [Ktedonobacteraceae bacterium]